MFLCIFPSSFYFSDVFVDWKQNVNEVTVRLRCGEGVHRIEDINTTFTDTHCHVCFPGKSEKHNRYAERWSKDRKISKWCKIRKYFCLFETEFPFKFLILEIFMSCRWTTVELPPTGGNWGLMQQSPVQGEGRFPSSYFAQEDPLSHLAIP